MFLLVLTWLIVTWGALACIYLLYHAWTRFPRRDIDDVVHFLYPVDLALAESLLDPAADFALRWNLSPRDYREAQRRRMRLYLELVRRMAHNSVVLVEFGNAVSLDGAVTAGSSSDLLQEAAIKVRLYSGCARVRLRLRLLLPNALGNMATPKLARLRKIAALDGLEAYGELKTAATEAFVQLHPSELEALSRNL